MARVLVVADDGWRALEEDVSDSVVASEHFRATLAERIAWAVHDAEAARPGGRFSRDPAREEPDR